MQLLRSILFEIDYGSLVDRDIYDTLDPADQILYRYTADGKSLLSTDEFEELEEKYPYDGGTLYRGLYFKSAREFDKFIDEVAANGGTITTVHQSSWSPSRSTAKDFATTVKTYFPTVDVMKAERDRADSGDYMTGEGGGVLLKIANAKPGVGIDVDKSKFAKESEVLLPPDTYEVTIDAKLRPFRISHGTLDKASELAREIDAFNRTGEGDKDDIEKYVSYLERSFIDELAPEEIDALITYSNSKILRTPPATFAQNVVDVEVKDEMFGAGKVLIVEVNPVYAPKLYSKASPRMQKIIDRQMSGVAKVLKSKIKDVIASGELEDLAELKIRGLRELREFVPSSVVDGATKELQRELGNMYQKMNSREVSKSLKSMDAIRAHGKKIANLVSAMAQF